MLKKLLMSSSLLAKSICMILDCIVGILIPAVYYEKLMKIISFYWCSNLILLIYNYFFIFKLNFNFINQLIKKMSMVFKTFSLFVRVFARPLIGYTK